jgi:hypothetical protein
MRRFCGFLSRPAETDFAGTSVVFRLCLTLNQAPLIGPRHLPKSSAAVAAKSGHTIGR